MVNAALRLSVSYPGFPCNCRGRGAVVSSRSCLDVRVLNRRQFASFSLQSGEIESFEPSVSSELTSTVGPSSALQPYKWTLTHRHIHVLSFISCAAAISATWLFCSAIPTLLAFKRAAESLEKLMDATREELPDTMAAVRLSGMEIGDLTMELSDLGQEITQGVRSSTGVVRLAEERLRRLTNMTSIAPVQEEVATKETRIAEPVLAKTARGIKEGIVKGRAAVKMFFTLTRFSKMLMNYMRFRAKA